MGKLLDLVKSKTVKLKTTFSLDEEVVKRLKAATAKHPQLSQSDIVTAALNAFLDAEGE